MSSFSGIVRGVSRVVHFSRYSHTSHVVDDTLILVGGVNRNDSPPGVCLIDLVSCEAREFSVPVKLLWRSATSTLVIKLQLSLQSQTSDGSPLMLVNHQAVMRDKNSILVVGGGGICFTFGTHLNRQPIVLDITDCWSSVRAIK